MLSDINDSTDETWIKEETWAKPFQHIPRFHNKSLSESELNICSCGKPLVLRYRKSDNHLFLCCSTFPKCRRTFQIIEK